MNYTRWFVRRDMPSCSVIARASQSRRREWIVAVAPPEGGSSGILLAIAGNQRIIGANRAFAAAKAVLQ
jgi:hypothetical protein